MNVKVVRARQLLREIPAKVGMVDHSKSWRIYKIHPDFLAVESYDGGSYQREMTDFYITEAEEKKFMRGRNPEGKQMSMDEIRKGIHLAIEQSVADKYEAFVETLTKWWFETAERFVANHKGKSWYDATHGQRGEANLFLISIAPDLRKMVSTSEVAGKYGGKDQVVGDLRSGAESAALVIATAEADQARAHFISKNTMKLENIIHNKGLYGVDGVEVTPFHGRAESTFQGSLELKFSDGMEFVVTNSRRHGGAESILGSDHARQGLLSHRRHAPNSSCVLR